LDNIKRKCNPLIDTSDNQVFRQTFSIKKNLFAGGVRNFYLGGQVSKLQH